MILQYKAFRNHLYCIWFVSFVPLDLYALLEFGSHVGLDTKWFCNDILITLLHLGTQHTNLTILQLWLYGNTLSSCLFADSFILQMILNCKEAMISLYNIPLENLIFCQCVEPKNLGPCMSMRKVINLISRILYMLDSMIDMGRYVWC